MTVIPNRRSGSSLYFRCSSVILIVWMITTPESAQTIQALLALPFLVIGISHILQPRMWIEFFTYLHGLGPTGVLLRTFGIELVPAVAIITFHFVWSGPEIMISVYGVLLAIKVTLSLLVPSIGLRSLSLADRTRRVSLAVAGVLLVTLSAVCFWSLLQ